MLSKSRAGIDKSLARFNSSIMQLQSKKRKDFIVDCASQIRDLQSDMRSLVATRLLSSQEFATEMNFSELHSSKGQSYLAWSCTDDSLSESSWRTWES
jgi:hypothetical protein